MINNKTNNSNFTEENEFFNLIRIFNRRKKIFYTAALTVLSLSIFTTFYNRIFNPIYQGNFTLLINDPLNKKSNNNSSSISEGLTELARNTTTNDIPTLIELLKSSSLLEPIAKEFNYDFDALFNRINIKIGGGITWDTKANGILKVSLITKNPKLDLKLLQKLSKVYLQTAYEQRRQKLEDGLKFLNTQAPELTTKTAVLRTKLAVFREENSLLEPQKEGGSLKELQIQTNIDLVKLESEKSRLENIKKQIKNGQITAIGYQDIITSGIRQPNAGTFKGLKVENTENKLLEEIISVREKIAKNRAVFTPNSSIIKTLKSKLNTLKPLLQKKQLEAVDTALRLNENNLKNLKLQTQKLDSSFQRQPELIKQYEEILQKLKIAQDNLTGLITARERFRLEIAQSTIPWRIIQEPYIKPIPIKPSIPRNLAIGMFFSIFSGIFAALLRDRLDNVYHSPQEIEDDLNVPILGGLPYIANYKNLRSDKEDNIFSAKIDDSESSKKNNSIERFFYQEAMRNLFTSLRFLNINKKVKIITFSSCVPKEGKTLITSLLSKALAELDQRVLLIDADLRKPQLHHRLGLNNIQGFSNLLADQTLNINDVKQNISEFPGWTVITSGTKPPNPTRLLSSSNLDTLIENISKSNDYDYVIFDSPPYLGLSDAKLLSQKSDGMILTISLHNIERNFPRTAIEEINNSNNNLFGVVYNSINPNSKRLGSAYKYGYGGYQYGYGYGYTYGNQSYLYDSYNNIDDDDDDDDETKKSDFVKDNLNKLINKAIERKKSLVNLIFTWLDK